VIGRRRIEALRRKGDVDGLIRALQREKPEERAEAARSLATAGDMRAVAALVAMLLADESTLCRHDAACALAVMMARGSAELRDACGRALSQEPSVYSALSICVGHEFTRAAQHLGSSLTMREAAVALAATQSIEAVYSLVDGCCGGENVEYAFEVAADALRSTSGNAYEVLIAAIRARPKPLDNLGSPSVDLVRAGHMLGKMGDPRTADDLISVLEEYRSYDESVRGLVGAAIGLGVLRDPKAVPALRAIVFASTSDAVRQEAARALATIGSPAADVLCEIARREKNKAVRQHAFDALLELREPASLPTILDAGRSYWEKPYLVRLLAEWGEPAAPGLAAIRDDDKQDPKVRRLAEEVLAAMVTSG